VAAIDDFPLHRQRAILWRFILDYSNLPEYAVRDEAAIDAMIHAVGTKVCPMAVYRSPGDGTPRAERGSDGRFHLIVGDRMLCSAGVRSGAYRHNQSLCWWTDQQRYSVQAPASAWQVGPDELPKLVVGTSTRREVRWSATLIGEVTDPATVHPTHRCPAYSSSYWPGHINKGPLGRIRAQLVAAFGPSCHACHRRPGSFVDHDHLTGYVRGHLCNFCNTHIDNCLHPDGCPFAEYLNNPPAAHWRLYCPSKRSRKDDTDATKAKIGILGYDPLFRGVTEQRRREPHRPPPPSAPGLDLSVVTQEEIF
jgi:Recombination endonuclease VII